jgi:hypothetical protein
VVNGNGLVISIRCTIYFKIENEERLPKLDYLLKHARTQKAILSIARVKIGEIYPKKNVNTKNEVLFT